MQHPNGHALDARQFADLVAAHVSRAGSTGRFCALHGLSEKHLAAVLTRGRKPHAALCRAVGVRPVTTYHPVATVNGHEGVEA